MAQNDGAAAAAMIVSIIVAAAAYYIGGLWWALGSFVISLFLSAMVAGLSAAPNVDRRYREALKRWNESYLCLRCGETARIGSDGSPVPLESGDPELDSLIRSGQRIQAVKLIVDKTGLGLAEAKARVDVRADELNVR